MQERWRKYPPKHCISVVWSTAPHKKTEAAVFNILDRNHLEFKCLFHTFDNYFCELCCEGIGAETHAAEILTPEEESKFWENGFFQ